jgi:hypothetical protein
MAKIINMFISSRNGECTTVKMMYDYMKSNPGDLNPKSI